MYPKVLVAIDGSPTSDAALDEAITLAKAQGSMLRLVHVVDVGPAYLTAETSFQLDEYERALYQAGEQILEKALAKVRATGLEAETKLIQIATINEHPADELVAEAQRWSADLIVVGTHGRRGFRHLLLGSVAEGVIRSAKQPVLLIRAS
jgi:nucleotide-binding universal stress UspA family protein